MNKVFEEVKLGNIKFKNRIIRSATAELLADEEGGASEKLVAMYERLAKGGVGAIITGNIVVSKQGSAYDKLCRLDDEKLVPSFKKLNDTIDKYYVPVIAQLVHNGSSSNSKVSGQDVISVSDMKSDMLREKVRAATIEEIKGIVASFVKSSMLAKKSGFKGIQLHGAHGYLLSEFLSSAINKRKDNYGGSLENRFRIIKEIIMGIKESVGDDYPLFIKLSAFDEQKNGITEDEIVTVCKWLKALGVSAVEVSSGYRNITVIMRMKKFPKAAIFKFIPQFKKMNPVFKTIMGLFLPTLMKFKKYEQNYNVLIAERIKKEADIPVIPVGGIRKIEDIENFIENRNIDFISLCRPLILEPDLVKKFEEKKQNESRCIDCGYCIIGLFYDRLKCYYGKV